MHITTQETLDSIPSDVEAISIVWEQIFDPLTWFLNLKTFNFENLSNKTNLKKIEIRYVDLWDKDFKNINKIPNLKTLIINKCFVHYVTELTKNTSIEELDLSYNKEIPMWDLDKFEKMKQLKVLKLRDIHISDPEIQYFLWNENLEVLDLSSNYITNSWLKYIVKFKNLKELILSHTYIKWKEAIDTLKELKKLEYLTVSWNWLKDEDIVWLVDLPNLKYLNLFGNELTDKAVNTITKLKNLKELNISFNHFTSKGIEEIINTLNLERIYVSCEKKYEEIKNSKKTKVLIVWN